MRNFGQIKGLILTALLLCVLYFGWEWLEPNIRRWLRGYPTLRTLYAEFSLLIFAALAFVLLTLSQWLWDRSQSNAD